VELKFVYQPADDVEAAAAFYRDSLCFEEAWRDGTRTVAFWLPGRAAQVMVSTTRQPPGLMFLVPDARVWSEERPHLDVAVPMYDIPGGVVVGFHGPNGSVFYVFDQHEAALHMSR